MNNHTTIAVKPATKEQIDKEKPDGMSYDLWIRQNALDQDPYGMKDDNSKQEIDELE